MLCGGSSERIEAVRENKQAEERNVRVGEHCQSQAASRETELTQGRDARFPGINSNMEQPKIISGLAEEKDAGYLRFKFKV